MIYPGAKRIDPDVVALQVPAPLTLVIWITAALLAA